VQHVLYSIHSSHKEIVEFLNLIQPLHITPITECDRSVLKVLHQYVHKDADKLRRTSVTVPDKIARLMRQGARKLGVAKNDTKAQLDKIKEEETNAGRRLSLQERSATAYGFVKQSVAGKKRKSMSDESAMKYEWDVRKRQKIDANRTYNNDLDRDDEINEEEDYRIINEDIAEIQSFQRKDKFEAALQSIEKDKSSEIPVNSLTKSSGEFILEYNIDEYECLDDNDVIMKPKFGAGIADRCPENESQTSQVDEQMQNDLLGSDKSSAKTFSESLCKSIANSNLFGLSTSATQRSEAKTSNSDPNSSFDEDNLFSLVAKEDELEKIEITRNIHYPTSNQVSNLFDEVLLSEKNSYDKRINVGDDEKKVITSE